MRFLLQKLHDVRRWRESSRQAQEFHARSRRRIAALDAAGQSHTAHAENAALFGARANERGRMVTIAGVRIS